MFALRERQASAIFSDDCAYIMFNFENMRGRLYFQAGKDVGVWYNSFKENSLRASC